MHDPSALIAITESFSEEIAQSLASFTSVLTQFPRTDRELYSCQAIF